MGHLGSASCFMIQYTFSKERWIKSFRSYSNCKECKRNWCLECQQEYHCHCRISFMVLFPVHPLHRSYSNKFVHAFLFFRKCFCGILSTQKNVLICQTQFILSLPYSSIEFENFNRIELNEIQSECYFIGVLHYMKRRIFSLWYYFCGHSVSGSTHICLV